MSGNAFFCFIVKIWRRGKSKDDVTYLSCLDCAGKKLGIFMKHNCVQMLIFKQRSIRCTSFGYSAPLVLMKCLA